MILGDRLLEAEKEGTWMPTGLQWGWQSATKEGDSMVRRVGEKTVGFEVMVERPNGSGQQAFGDSKLPLAPA